MNIDRLMKKNDERLQEKIITNPRTRIRIVSGEGVIGGIEEYNGKRSIRALKLRLTKEASDGDRFAYAEYYIDGEHGDEYTWGKLDL